MKKALISIVVIVILIAAGGYLWLRSSSGQNNQNQDQNQNQPPATSSSNSEPTAANTIVFDGSSFSPATLTVKSGTTVTIKNVSSQDMQFDSDPHPVHTDDPELNVGTVAPGSSVTFTVTKTGSYGYHDHLDPSIQGRIVVE